PPDFHGWPQTLARRESDLARLLDWPLGRQHPGNRDQRLQRQILARYRGGPPLYRSPQSHRTPPPNQLRRARSHRNHRRSKNLRQALDHIGPEELPAARNGHPRIRLQRERERRPSHGWKMRRLLFLLFPAVLLAQQADLILSNGKIVTVDDRFSI